MRRALPILLVLTAACGGSSGTLAVGDSTYVAAMGELYALEQTSRAKAIPAPPPFTMPTLAPASGPALAQWRRDSVARRVQSDAAFERWRADSSTRRVRDSTARAQVLARFQVTPAALEASAQQLVDDPKRARLIWEAVQRRASAVSNQASGLAPSAGAGPIAPSPAARITR